MAKELPYTLTHESITVIHEGKSHVVQKGAPQFKALRKALMDEDWAAVPNHLTVAKSIKDWAKGKFTLKGNNFSFDGVEIPANINTRVIEMATKGDDPTPLFNFWERLQRNPSMRSVEQLWPFLAHKGIPLTKEGKFLAYKGVRSDFKDAHSGTWDNSPGVVNKMPRNQISDDPKEACHEGFHVGALEYAGTFSQRVVVCEVDPEHVVCVPYDSNQHKMRVCEYKVIGNHNGEHLPSTVFLDDRHRNASAAKEYPPDVNEELEAEEAEDEVEEGYDPKNDFLADSCEECDQKIPMDYAADNNKYHDEGCSSYDATYPSKAEEEKAAKAEKKAKKSEKKAAPKKEKKGIEKKKERKAMKKAGKALAKSFEKLNKMGSADLLGESLDTLRDYAGKGLKIVGASKVPGGKTALVGLIMKTKTKPSKDD